MHLERPVLIALIFVSSVALFFLYLWIPILLDDISHGYPLLSSFSTWRDFLRGFYIAHDIHTVGQAWTLTIAKALHIASVVLIGLFVIRNDMRRFLWDHKWSVLIGLSVVLATAYVLEKYCFRWWGPYPYRPPFSTEKKLSFLFWHYMKRSHFSYTLLIFLGICGLAAYFLHAVPPEERAVRHAGGGPSLASALWDRAKGKEGEEEEDAT